MTSSETLLLDCLHREPSRLRGAGISRLTNDDWDALLDLARPQRVRPLIRRRLNAPDVRDDVPAHVLAALHTAGRQIAMRNLALHAEAARLLAIFAREDIPVILLKGLHVATAIYGDVALREIGDMDLLVRRDHLARATSLALSAGYVSTKPFAVDVDAAVARHVCALVRPPNYVLELHWNLTEPGQPYTIDPAPLWSRARPVRISNVPALVLSPEDLLMHLCEHLSYHHCFEFGIRSLCDVAELLRAEPDQLHWDRVRERAEAWGWQRGVGLGLQLAHQLLGANLEGPAGLPPIPEVPPGILDAAITQILAGPNAADRPGGRVSGLMEPGIGPKFAHLSHIFFESNEQLAREYPTVARRRWLWWTVYLLRGRDLFRRHGRTLFRMWVQKDPSLLSAGDRQRQLRSYLSGA